MDVNAVDESFHEHVTLNESSFICDSCGKKYQTKSGLQKHLNSKHGASGGNLKLECQTCKLKFTTKGHLEGHVNSHHDLNHMPARFVISAITTGQPSSDMCPQITQHKRKNHLNQSIPA